MSAPVHDVYRFGRYFLSPSRHALYHEEAEVPLAPKAFEVLLYLARNPGRVVTKEEILKAVWPDAFIEESNLAQQIFRLRKAFETEPEAANFIRTIPGRGYQFTAEVSQQALTPAVQPIVDAGPMPAGFSIDRYRERTRVVVEEIAVRPLALQVSASSPVRRNLLISICLLLVAAFLAAWQWHSHRLPPQSHKLVVADFLNTTGDPAFDHTLNRALDIDLSQSPYMDILSERDVVGTLQLMGQKADTPLNADVAHQICIRTNRKTLLTPSISSVGREYLLALEATDCETGKQIASAKAEAASKERILTALDSLADRMRSKLGETANSVESFQVPIAQATTPSLEALKSYSLGASIIAQGKDDTEAIPFFQKAIDLDPKFAMAYGALATAYYNLSEYKKATDNYAKAFALSDNVSAKEKLLLQAHYYGEGNNDLEGGIRIYQMWTTTYPNDFRPFINLADLYIQLGQYTPAITAAEQALKLQPERAINYSVLTRAYMHANRFAEAKEIAQRAIAHHQDSVGVHASLSDIVFMEHDQAAMAREATFAAANKTGWYAWYFSYIKAEAAAADGKLAESEDFYRQSYKAAEAQKSSESADGLLIDQAQMELDFGYPEQARATLKRIANKESDFPDIALINSRVGNSSLAEHYLAEHEKKTAATFMTFLYVPRIRAELAMAHNKPLEAVAALEPATPYELADYTILDARADAYIKAGQPAMAITVLQLALANPGIDTLAYDHALDHLGLARAYALEKKATESAHEYETLFTLWKDADSTLPVLRQAHLEYAKLTETNH